MDELVESRQGRGSTQVMNSLEGHVGSSEGSHKGEQLITFARSVGQLDIVQRMHCGQGISENDNS